LILEVGIKVEGGGKHRLNRYQNSKWPTTDPQLIFTGALPNTQTTKLKNGPKVVWVLGRTPINLGFAAHHRSYSRIRHCPTMFSVVLLLQRARFANAKPNQGKLTPPSLFRALEDLADSPWARNHD
jgi:hypothetical protein